MLKDQSVSTSEQTASSLLGEDSAGHIIDPDTGKPLRTGFAVSVIAQTGTVSDALSTTSLLLGPAEGKALIHRMPGVSAIWISRDAQIEMVTGGAQIVFGRRF
jgi:thiamine biosynthesis lipoprotein ApbE